jgi:hypothetical protein
MAEDWCDNSKWFNVKFLVDVNGSNPMMPIQNISYSKYMKELLTRLGIPDNDLCHLGRKLGTKFLDLLEEATDEVHKMGQWTPLCMTMCIPPRSPFQPSGSWLALCQRAKSILTQGLLLKFWRCCFKAHQWEKGDLMLMMELLLHLGPLAAEAIRQPSVF